MYLIHLYPIQKGTWAKELTYWSTVTMPLGSMIEIPLRGKKIFGLVFDCKPIHDAKSAIKNTDFRIRKIEHPSPLSIVSKGYLRALMNASSYFVVPVGVLMKNTIPACALNTRAEEVIVSTLVATEAIPSASGSTHDVTVVGLNNEDRYSIYKGIIREHFAKKQSTLIVSPTIKGAVRLFEHIKKGIDHSAKILQSSMSQKQLAHEWINIPLEEKPCAIVTTPQFSSIPRKDIGVIIVDDEAQRMYKTFQYPYFDWRTIIESYGKEIGAKVVYGDQLLSLETLHRVEEVEIHEALPVSYRINTDAEILVVNQKPVQKHATDTTAKTSQDKTNRVEPKLWSEEFMSMVEYALKKKQRMFIFTARKGLSPQTICHDCKKTVVCNVCTAPVVLHKNKKTGDQYFLCHHCGKERTALETCKTCGSWNLVSLGIGTDTVHAMIKKAFPEARIFSIDRTHTKTDNQVKQVLKEFNEDKNGAILIGTELALNHLEKVPYVAVASMDSLFSIPDLCINERIAHIIIKLLSVTESYLLIQTRNTEHGIIRALQQKTFADFVREELSLRETLDYPPYTCMGKIVVTDKHAAIRAKDISLMLEAYDPIIFPAFIPRESGPSITILFKIPKKTWSNEATRLASELYSTLKKISEIAEVHIRPDSFI